MEYLEGCTLARYMADKGGRLPLDEALALVRQVGEALQVVHEAGQLHRDIKPANIMRCEDGRTVLIDFGAARDFNKDGSMSQTVILTPGYAPLEQHSREGKRGPYTDVYALGATLYALLTGQAPPDAVARVSGVETPIIESYGIGASDNISKAIIKAMAVKTEERFQTVGEFLEVLKDIQVQKVEPSAVTKQNGDNSEYYTEGDNTCINTTAVMETNMAGYGHLRLIVEELGELEGHSPSHIAFSLGGNLLAAGRFDNFIKLWDVASGKELHAFEIYSDWLPILLDFSQDGRFLASSDLRAVTVKLWDVASGKELHTFEIHNDSLGKAAFSLDGNLLASSSQGKLIKLWDVASGRELCTLEGHSYEVSSLAFSPDGSLLASGSIDKTVSLWDVVRRRKLHTLKWHVGTVEEIAFSQNGRFISRSPVTKALAQEPLNHRAVSK